MRAPKAPSASAVTPCSTGPGIRTQNGAFEPAISVTARISQPISGGLE
jgi:hypothetical protein